jgi:hypothetical protein
MLPPRWAPSRRGTVLVTTTLTQWRRESHSSPAPTAGVLYLTSPTGRSAKPLVLPEFLAPGMYDLFSPYLATQRMRVIPLGHIKR